MEDVWHWRKHFFFKWKKMRKSIRLFRSRDHYNSSYLLLLYNTTEYKNQLRESYFCQIEVTGGKWYCSPPKDLWIYKLVGSIGFWLFCFIWFTAPSTAVLILSWGILSILAWRELCHQPSPRKHCQISKFLFSVWRGTHSKEHLWSLSYFFFLPLFPGWQPNPCIKVRI